MCVRQMNIYTTTKLLSRDEFVKYLKTKTIPDSKNVKTIPVRAARFLKNNSKKLASLNSQPYFLADNYTISNNKIAIKKSIGSMPKIPVLKVNPDLESLKELGVKVVNARGNYEIFQSKAKGFNFGAMFSELENQLVAADIKNVSKTVMFNSKGFDFKLVARNFEMTRKVTYADNFNKVYHAYLRVPEKAQGKGLTKKMFQILFDQYENGNIKEINVTANINIGGYAWARYGFSATNRTEVLEIIKNSSNGTWKKKALEKVNKFYKKNGIDSAFPMGNIARMKGGKESLLNSWWSGTINLNDKKQLDVFKNYLFRK